MEALMYIKKSIIDNFRSNFLSKNLTKALLVSSLTVASATTAFAAAEVYQLDPSHTFVTWHASHFGFSNPSGVFSKVEGNLMLDEKNLKDSKVKVKFDISGLSTGNPEFDMHLKSEKFFDIDKYPTASFESTKVVLKGKDRADVHGMLELHGYKGPVVLHVKLNKKGANPFTKAKTLGFSAEGMVKRSVFGMKGMVDMGIGDDVKITIETEAFVAEAPKS
jgi:polyisoprenoid-binding protein YceI